MGLCAISISQLVLNEIAWSPGDPGTGAPSIFGDLVPRACVAARRFCPNPIAFLSAFAHGSGDAALVEHDLFGNRLPLLRMML
jgi:hypothetical protein